MDADEEQRIRAEERYKAVRDLRAHLIRTAQTYGLSDSPQVRPLMDVITGEFHRARAATGRPIGDRSMAPNPESKRSRQRRQERYLRRMLQCTTRVELLALLNEAEEDGAATQYLVEWTTARADLLEQMADLEN